MFLFSLITQKSVPVFHGMCVKLDAYMYSKGSDPREEYVQYIVVVPPIPLSATPSGQTKFSLEYRHSDLQVSEGNLLFGIALSQKCSEIFENLEMPENILLLECSDF